MKTYFHPIKENQVLQTTIVVPNHIFLLSIRVIENVEYKTYNVYWSSISPLSPGNRSDYMLYPPVPTKYKIQSFTKLKTYFNPTKKSQVLQTTFVVPDHIFLVSIRVIENIEYTTSKVYWSVVYPLSPENLSGQMLYL